MGGSQRRAQATGCTSCTVCRSNKDVPFQVSAQGNEKKITGTIPCKPADFKIDPPTLLTMPIKNDIPVKVDMTWKQQ